MTFSVYMVRHGQTQLNKYRRMQGWCDSPLTAKGIADAHKAGRHLALAEARDLDLLGQGLVGLVEFGLELVEGDLDGDLDAGGALLLDGGLHWLHTPVSRL